MVLQAELQKRGKAGLAFGSALSSVLPMDSGFMYLFILLKRTRKRTLNQSISLAVEQGT